MRIVCLQHEWIFEIIIKIDGFGVLRLQENTKCYKCISKRCLHFLARDVWDKVLHQGKSKSVCFKSFDVMCNEMLYLVVNAKFLGGYKFQ